MIEERVRRDFPNLTVVLTASEPEAMRLVSERQADLTIRSLIVAASAIKKEGLFNLKISGQVPEYTNQLRMDMSPSVERLRGYAVAEVMQQTLDEALTPASARIAEVGLGRALAAVHAKTPVPAFQAELEQPCKHGGTVWSEVMVSGIQNESGEFINLLGVTRDISERKRAELELHIAAAAFESRDGMFVTDAQQIILRVNSAFTQITGYEAQEVIGKTPKMLGSGRHDADFYQTMWAAIESADVWHGEIWNRRKNGEVFPAQLTITAVTGSTGEVAHYVAILHDITLRKKLEAEVAQLAFFDPLTQLPNRRLFNDRFSQALAHAKRAQTTLALMFIDLDKFKPINDEHGHEAGDWVLQTVAQRMESCLRASDTAARVGGDEFLVLLADIQTGNDAWALADKIRLALDEPFVTPSGLTLAIAASIGIAVYPDHGQTEQDLMRRGDSAMYQAKKAGGNCAQLCGAPLTDPTKSQAG